MLGPINVESGAWLGAKSIVCPGVTVASHAILSVGSLANKDLEPYTIYKRKSCCKMQGTYNRVNYSKRRISPVVY